MPEMEFFNSIQEIRTNRRPPRFMAKTHFFSPDLAREGRINKMRRPRRHCGFTAR
jgi:hypothetical protein